MQLNAFISPVEAAISIFSRKSLIFSLIRRDIYSRYQGSMLGIVWSFLTPLIMLLVYTFVFSVVFEARWGESQSRTEFAVILFIGLMLFNLFSEVLSRSPGLIIGNVSFVKKVVFPLEILSVVAVGSTLFHLTTSFTVWLLVYGFLYGVPGATCLYFPLLLFPLCLFALGFSWFLAALGVYLRDLGQLIMLLTTMLMFLSPIFYPVSALPPAFRSALYCNPLSFFIEQARGVLMWHQVPDWNQLSMMTALSICVAYLGLCWFQKARGGFADVL